MIRTIFPYGTFVKIHNEKYKRKTFRYLHSTGGQAVIFHLGQSEVSSFYLLVDPLKVYRKKGVAKVAKPLALLNGVRTIELLENNVELVHTHSFPQMEETVDKQTCLRCGKVFNRVKLKLVRTKKPVTK